MPRKKNVWWVGEVPEQDDFGDKINGEFVDGKTRHGPWATMTRRSWAREGVGLLGPGWGQMYRRQRDGRWLKVEG